MNLTVAALQQMMPKAPPAWLQAVVDEIPKSSIDTPNEVASFLAQVAHESDELTRVEENLYYSAGRMAQVWTRFSTNPAEKDLKKRIPNELAFRYQNNPVALANYVYANRMGNGDEHSGDGWRTHGRGPGQITGTDNYRACGLWMGVDLLANPENLLSPELGIRSVIWFWHANGMDVLDDDADVRLETRRFNGGDTGLARRQDYFDRILQILESA